MQNIPVNLLLVSMLGKLANGLKDINLMLASLLDTLATVVPSIRVSLMLASWPVTLSTALQC